MPKRLPKRPRHGDVPSERSSSVIDVEPVEVVEGSQVVIQEADVTSTDVTYPKPAKAQIGHDGVGETPQETPQVDVAEAPQVDVAAVQIDHDDGGDTQVEGGDAQVAGVVHDIAGIHIPEAPQFLGDSSCHEMFETQV